MHSDLKTENILVRKAKNGSGMYELTQIKLIDYGSSFPFDDLKQFSMATPEYDRSKWLDTCARRF